MSAKKNQQDSLVRSFLDVLHEKKQDDLLPSVSAVIAEKVKKEASKNQAVVWSVVPVSSNLLKRFARVIEKYTKQKPEMVNKIDEKLLGGFRIELGDWVLDASLKRDYYNLEKLLS